MAVDSRGRAELARRWRERERERETSPERTKVWTEPRSKATAVKKVPVVYYLTRNGYLEHPHFMEVALSYGEGLYLRDVINRLDILRGKGMASHYSWSSKRRYMNGFVWQDLTEDDFIYPAHGQEYVLKGSELLLLHQNSNSSTSTVQSQDTTTSAATSSSHETEIISKSSQDDSDAPLMRRKKKQWCSLDLGEYKVYQPDTTAEDDLKAAADASTQTEDQKQWKLTGNENESQTTEVGRDETSPPLSSWSSESVEPLFKIDEVSRAIKFDVPEDEDGMVSICSSGRARASAVLMNLISCGAISLKETRRQEFVPQNRRTKLPSGSTDMAGAKEAESNRSFHFPPAGLEAKCFSGSLIETKKKTSDGYNALPALKRSSSYNADRCSKLDLTEKEVESVRAKCVPRKPRTDAEISRSAHESKRITDEVKVPRTTN